MKKIIHRRDAEKDERREFGRPLLHACLIGLPIFCVSAGDPILKARI